MSQKYSRFQLLKGGRTVREFESYTDFYRYCHNGHEDLTRLAMCASFVMWFDVVPLRYDIKTKKLEGMSTKGWKDLSMSNDEGVRA